ncbi:MAG: ABC transporter substrate-binding protein [Dehalococcoidia bacterium]|nr:ABC transporter substrate-binding protein [Dehalococcoidia bacterium]
MGWKQSAPRRFNRRHFLGAAGALAGAAGLSALSCSGGGNGSGQGGPIPGLTRETGDDETVTVAATRPALSERHGETLRYTGYVAGDGVFDPHKTQAAPFYGQQALVLSRLLNYASQTEGIIVPDLAQALPEQPDAQTLIFRLRPDARWHELEPLNGRPVTAEDVRFSIQRQIEGDTSFVRKGRWLVVESVEAVSTTEVKVKLTTPFANAMGLFADVNSFVVAPESEFGPSSQVGSGPFQWVEWNEGTFASVARNPVWHGGDQRPYLDGIELRHPKDASDIEAGLRTKKLDVVFVGRQQADHLMKNITQLVETNQGHSLYFGSRFFLTQPPYDDPRFRGAISIALDRREMVDRFFAGSGDINPWVSWPMTRWSLPQSELTNFPGYRAGAGGRDVDIAEAKEMLAAFASEKTVPSENALFVEAAAETNLGLGSLIKEQLARTLGLNVTVTPLAIGDLIKKMIAQEAPWVAGPDVGWVDLDDWVYPYFHSAGSNNSFPVRDSDLDALIESQRIETDEAKRRQTGFEIQRKILNLHAGLNFVSERVIALQWPYVRDFPIDAADGYQHRFADCWIDRSDETFRGR